MPKLRSVQVMRAIAALAVAWGHIYFVQNGASMVTEVAGAGVDLFFVISGFIMATVSRGRSAGDFLLDRLWRIYPLWLIAVLPWLPTIGASPPGWAASLTLWPIYGSGYYGPALGVGWTLGFEMIFYCAMTIALATRPAVPIALYATCIALSLATQVTLFGFLGSPLALEFLAGVVIAHLPRRRFAGAPLVAIVAAAALFIHVGHERPEVGAITPALAALRAVTWGIPCAIIFYCLLCMDRLFDHPAFAGAVLLGDASYSLYLFHPIFAYGVKLPWLPNLTLAVTTAVAIHLGVERRIMAARRAWRWPYQLRGRSPDHVVIPKNKATSE